MGYRGLQNWKKKQFYLMGDELSGLLIKWLIYIKAPQVHRVAKKQIQ
jgi:hypothetical protein